MDLSSVTSLGPRTTERLREVGIATVDALANADVDKLAADLDVPVERARAFVREAQALAATAQADWKVVLRDHAATATLHAGDRLVDALPIVTARPDEDPARLRVEVDHPAVVLAQGESTAWVRLEDGWHASVPLYKERMGAEGAKEIRVKVHEIRERAPAASGEDPASRAEGGAEGEGKGAKKGLFGKLFKKKT